jgi:hypothetical protein
MALDFPPGTPGATYTGPNGVIWSWDGVKWLAGTSASVYAPIASPAFSGNPTAPTPAAGDADTSIATTAFVTNAVATSLHDVGRNYLHNSMFNIAQRGVGNWVATGYTADRWNFLLSGGTGTVSITAIVDAAKATIGDEAALWCWQNNCVGGAGAGDYQILIQPIEGIRRLSGKTVTLSFWANSSGTPKVGISFTQAFGTGGSPSATVNATGQAITLSNTWARYSVTTTIPSTAGKTFGTNKDDHLDLEIWMSAGSSYATRAGIGQQSATFQLWGVQLELGPTATPLEKLDPVTQLQQCQRFYQGIALIGAFYGVAGSGAQVAATLPVIMRGNPTVALGTNANSNVSGLTVGADVAKAYTANGTATATGTVWISQNALLSADL